MNPKQWTIGKCAAMLMIAGGTVMSSEAGWEAELQKLPAAEGRPPSESSEADWLIDNSDYESTTSIGSRVARCRDRNAAHAKYTRLPPLGSGRFSYHIMSIQYHGLSVVCANPCMG